MTANQLTWKLATTTVLLLMCATPFVPMVSACTPGSFLCPADAGRDRALGAASDGQHMAVGMAQDASADAIPMALDRESQAFGAVDDARQGLDETYANALVTATGSVDDARDTVFGTVGDAVSGLPATVNGLGDGVDSSITDLQSNTVAPTVKLAVDTIDSVGMMVDPIVTDPVGFATDVEAQVEGPIDQELQDLDTYYIHPAFDAVVGVIGGIDIGPVLDAYDQVTGATFSMLNHNYGLLAGRFSALPPESQIEGLESNL